MTFATHPRKYQDILPAVDNAAALIFDNDGTLVDTMPVHYTAWKQALNEYRIHFSETQFYQLAGLPAPAIINLLKEQQNVFNVTVEQVISTRATLLEHLLTTVIPIQPTLKLLQYAQSRNIPVAVASGSERADVLTSLRSAGVDPSIFAALVTADDVVNGKPHPETFLTAAERLGVEPSKCIGFEDGDKGLQALRAAGMQPIDVRFFEDYPLPQCLK